MRKANVVDTQEGEKTRDAMIALCEKLGELTTIEDCDTDDEELYSHAYTALTMYTPDDPEDDTITVRAHLEYTKSGNRQYAISDSGADSSILGENCHVVSYTGRSAYLIGYDPTTTRSAKIPIISGYLKVMAHSKVPIVLLVNEAP